MRGTFFISCHAVDSAEVAQERWSSSTASPTASSATGIRGEGSAVFIAWEKAGRFLWWALEGRLSTTTDVALGKTTADDTHEDDVAAEAERLPTEEAEEVRSYRCVLRWTWEVFSSTEGERDGWEDEEEERRGRCGRGKAETTAASGESKTEVGPHASPLPDERPVGFTGATERPQEEDDPDGCG